MHSSKILLTHVIFIAFVAFCHHSRILGELKITVRSGSYCLLETENKTDIESFVTVYGNMSRSCDLQINASSSSQVAISVIAGNITGLDYIYVERLGSLGVCPDHFVSLMGPLEPCSVNFANDAIRLYVRGDIVLGIHDVMIETDHVPGCPENVIWEDKVDALKGQISSCKHVKRFSSVIQCVNINAGWVETVLSYLDYKPGPSTKCNVQCPDNCSCILSDRQVIYNCSQDLQSSDKIYSSFILFSSDIYRLDLGENRITALETNTFTNIGTHIVSLNLSFNLLSSLQKGVFTNLQSLVHLSLFNNSLTTLNPGIFDNLHSLVFLSAFVNELTTLSRELFSNLHVLKDLYINNNALVKLVSKTFHSLYTLKSLFLSSNKINHCEDGTFYNLSELTHLALGRNYLSFLPFHLFDDLLSLTHLDLAANRLQSLPRIGHMMSLSLVDLLGNPLTKVNQNMFYGVPRTASVYANKPVICFCYLNGSDTCFYTIKPSPYLTCNRLLSLPLLTTSIWIIGCGAFLGNAFVLWWKQFKREAINKVQSLLLSNLALSDLLMGTYMIIIASADLFYGEHFPMNAESWRSGITCRFAGTLAITSSEASVLFVTLISVDRFITIRYPYSLHKFDIKSTWIISSIVWTFSLTLGLVASTLSGRNLDFYDNSHVCIGLPLTQVIVTETNTREMANVNWWEDATLVQVVNGTQTIPGLYFSAAVFIAFNMLCFLSILASYIAIIREVSKTSRAASRQREMAEEIRMTIKVSAIVLTDFFCWFPICLIGVLVQIGLLELPNSVFAWVVTLVLPINSAINPFLYTLVTIISEKCSNGASKPASVSQPIQMQSLSRSVQDATDADNTK